MPCHQAGGMADVCVVRGAALHGLPHVACQVIHASVRLTCSTAASAAARQQQSSAGGLVLLAALSLRSLMHSYRLVPAPQTSAHVTTPLRSFTMRPRLWQLQRRGVHVAAGMVRCCGAQAPAQQRASPACSTHAPKLQAAAVAPPRASQPPALAAAEQACRTASPTASAP